MCPDRCATYNHGSSPQARGTPTLLGLYMPAVRFIPAGAGNTDLQTLYFHRITVHPRRRGEHTFSNIEHQSLEGSSPQARGTLAYYAVNQLRNRFIPAGAGNTPAANRARTAAAVHPRRRGEHSRAASPASSYAGSSPQARGTPAEVGAPEVGARFIPAGAGNTGSASGASASVAVHPRRRGEHAEEFNAPSLENGSSPQARGTLFRVPPHMVGDRFIPAGAGNTRDDFTASACAAVHPRRRGEHWHRRDALPRDQRFIPAGAGNTHALGVRPKTATVHPRRRGEHILMPI